MLDAKLVGNVIKDYREKKEAFSRSSFRTCRYW